MNYPLWQVLQKSNASRRLLNWVIELSEYDINYVSRMEIKRQALANFIAEFTHQTPLTREDLIQATHTTFVSENVKPIWKLYFDGSSTKMGLGARIVLVSLENNIMHFKL